MGGCWLIKIQHWKVFFAKGDHLIAVHAEDQAN